MVMASSKNNSRFQPDARSGRVANAYGETHEADSLAGHANHSANHGRHTGSPVDARVGGKNSVEHLKAAPPHGGMVHKGHDGVLRTGGGQAHSLNAAVQSGSVVDPFDYLKAPAPVFPSVQAAYGQRSRTAESGDALHMGRKPGENMRRNMHNHNSDLGAALLNGSIRSGSSVIDGKRK